jgi:glucose-1-phosphate thymidylyltransferase
MKAIIPAAGSGSRLGLGCKALVNIEGKPLIKYALDSVVRLGMGIEEAVIIQNEKDVENAIGYEYQGLRLLYVTQLQKKGIAHAVMLTKDLIGTDDVFIIFSDIYFNGGLKELRTFFAAGSNYICVQRVPNKEMIKQSYGVTRNKVLVEKPTDVTDLMGWLGLGIYMLRNEIFGAISRTPASLRTNQVEFTEALNQLSNKEFINVSGDYVNINFPTDLEKARRKEQNRCR